MNFYNRIKNHQLKRCLILGPVFLVVFLCMGTVLYSQNKLALIIGNSDYENAQLRNSVNDAQDVTVMLINKGFMPTLNTNLDHDQFEESIRIFIDKIKSGDIVLFYYSGHGMQVKGENYLIPVKEKIVAEDEIRYKSISLSMLLDKLYGSGSAINIIILDACRDNPFSGFRSSSKGFTSVTAPIGTIISYSTAPGSVARDGEGRNSPYTESLLECSNLSNLQLEEFFKEVRKKVLFKTSNQQQPWETSSLIEDFYFTSGEDAYSRNPAPVSPQAKRESNPNNVFSESKPIEDFNSNSGTFVDSRDGQEYKWVKIGDQIWMGENLNIGTLVNNKKNQLDNKIIEKYCYHNEDKNCRIYGGLYQWMEMMDYTAKSQGICPSGWHIPTSEEWQILIYFVGNEETAGNQLKMPGGIYWKMSKKMKKKYLMPVGSGFNALPGGMRNISKKFYGINEKAGFWASGQSSYNIYSNTDLIKKYSSYPKYGLSVRCIKDDQD